MNLKWIACLYIAFILFVIMMVDQEGGWSVARQISVIPYGDKLGHFLLMGTLALLVNLLMNCRCWRLGKLNILQGSIIVLVLVTLEEFSQIFVPSRTFDLIDLTADYLGIWVFGLLAVYLHRRQAQAKSL